MSYDELFQPIEIGNVKLKNRIAMSPMNMGFTGPNGYHSDQATAWYAMRARGGFGLIITECVVMNSYPWNGSEIMNPSLLTDKRYSRFHSECVDLVHEYNHCKIFMQLSPGWGRNGHPHADTPGIPSAAPSPIGFVIDLRNLNRGWEKQLKRCTPEISQLIPDFEALRKMNDDEYSTFKKLYTEIVASVDPDLLHSMYGDTPRELTIKEIEDLEDRFAESALLGYQIGYDGIEIHGPHGYLISQFLSARSNQRHDKYGGTLENRARFLLNIIDKTRKRVGKDKVLGVRLSGAELMPGGITHDEAKQTVAWCRDAGSDFFNISQGSYENPAAAFAPDGEGEYNQWGPGFRENSGGKPVIVPSFITPEKAVDAIKSGAADIISLGRQSIADPFWPVKVKEGRLSDINKCIRCQRCYMDLMTNNWATCSVNPIVGREKLYSQLWLDTPSLQKKYNRFIEKANGLPQI